ncbi:hypothetical protein E2C01_032603 [Portunus trituberculatus]|uniref:Uncharacterized protein n=1 Tax=Portunus trituberculatus TaxID=210409 RepID=A0A5B7F1U8_PORTR|nr:hypothetical protein [Portunus trituberculatus]
MSSCQALLTHMLVLEGQLSSTSPEANGLTILKRRTPSLTVVLAAVSAKRSVKYGSQSSRMCYSLLTLRETHKAASKFTEDKFLARNKTSSKNLM